MKSISCKKTLFLVISLIGCGAAHAEDSPCSAAGGSLGGAQCVAQKLTSLEGELESVYQSALDKLPDVSRRDIRKAKDQLRKAQSAWRIYRDENCDYVGGLQGGSNMSVTEFSTECALEETEKRIDFFRNLPMGG